MTTIITGLNPGIKPSIINFRKWLLFTDGDNIPRYLDQNAGFNWRHVDPTTAITTDETQAGTMSGIYKYFYTEANITSGDGNIHNSHETNPSPIFTTGTLASKKVVLTLPGSASNSGFTHLKIYSTDAGGSIYYYIGKVTIGTTSLEDNNLTRDVNFPFGELYTATTGSTSQRYLNYSIPNFKFVTATKTRIIGLGTRAKTTGTIAVTNASATVTGTGTLWTKALEGCVLYVNNASRGYTVLTVGSTTSITLAENYAGSNATGQSYEIVLFEGDSMIGWTAKNPLTAYPMWWAWPQSYRRYIRRRDDSDFFGCGSLGDQVIVFKKNSHYLLTESGNDFIDTESVTKIGTGSHWSIVTDSDNGRVYFITPMGKLYRTSGLSAEDLNVDLTETEDGINLTYIEKCEAVWYEQKKWYVMIYPAEGETYCNKILIYERDTQNFVILDIYSNCIAIVEETDSGQIYKKPWIGTIGGFVYKLLTGNSLGGASGTLEGTVTSSGNTTLTDSTASFYITNDGLKDLYVSLFNSSGNFVEERKISSNTGTQLTVDTAWTTNPDTTYTYEIGSIRWSWKSKIFDYGIEEDKVVRNAILNFYKTSASQNVRINLYISDDPEMPATKDQYLEFNTSYDYYDSLSFYDNRSKYMQFEIAGHGTNDPVTITSLTLQIEALSK